MPNGTTIRWKRLLMELVGALLMWSLVPVLSSWKKATRKRKTIVAGAVVICLLLLGGLDSDPVDDCQPADRLFLPASLAISMRIDFMFSYFDGCGLLFVRLAIR